MIFVIIWNQQMIYIIVAIELECVDQELVSLTQGKQKLNSFLILYARKERDWYMHWLIDIHYSTSGQNSVSILASGGNKESQA